MLDSMQTNSMAYHSGVKLKIKWDSTYVTDFTSTSLQNSKIYLKYNISQKITIRIYFKSNVCFLIISQSA